MTTLDLSKLNLSLKITILSLLVTSALTGCGIRGNLKTPPPLFGGQAKVDPERVPTDKLSDDVDNAYSDDFDLLNQDLLDDDELDDS